MICPKCSQQIPDDSRFCQRCGTPVTPAVAPGAATPEPNPYAEQPIPGVTPEPSPYAEQPVPGVTPEPNPYAEQPAPGVVPPYTQNMPETKVKKGLPKPALYGIIGGGIFLLAAVITLLIVFLLMDRTTRYNLNDYTDVSFEGLNGIGNAEVEIDEESLATRIAQDMGYDVDKIKDMDVEDLFQAGSLDEIMNLYLAITSIQVSADRANNLSNGDTIRITYRFDKDKAEKVGAEFVGEPMTVTVTNLEEIQTVDPFSSLDVKFEGVAPQAYMGWEVSGSAEWMSALGFSVSQRDHLSNGDTVEMTVEGYNEDDFMERFGVRLAPLQKTYTVSGVDEYVTENMELDSDIVEQLEAITEDYVLSYFGDSSRADAIQVSDLQYEGYYLLTSRKDDIWGGFNKVYMILSGKVSSTEKKKQFKPKKVYFPVEYDDIKKLANGDYDVGTDYKRILGSTDLQYGYWQTVSGYTDKSQMEEELIEDDSDNYDGHIYGTGQ